MGHKDFPGLSSPSQRTHFLIDFSHGATKLGTSGNMIRTIDLTAPQGTRLLPSVHGAQLQFDDSKKSEVIQWLQTIASNLETHVETDLVKCPRCGGVPRIFGDTVDICPLCKGQYRVTKQTAIEYATALGIVATIIPSQPVQPKIDPLRPAVVAAVPLATPSQSLVGVAIGAAPRFSPVPEAAVTTAGDVTTGDSISETPFIGPIFDPELAGQPPIGPVYNPELAGKGGGGEGEGI